MSLPFTHAQFLDVFSAYNSALWPAALALWLLSATAVISFARARITPRTVAALLAVHWLWSGIAYHLAYFAAINPAARLFGIVFGIEAGLIGWFGIVRSQLVFGRGAGLRGTLATVFLVYALVYPFLSLATGLHWPRMPAFGVPCPTTLFTVGFLLFVPPRQLRGLSVIPIVWSVIGGSAAVLLGVVPDLVLLLGGALLLLQLVAPRALPGARPA